MIIIHCKGEEIVPELPEMETYRALLENKIKGKIITEVEINREKSINKKADVFINQVKTKRITKIKRRAKYLIFTLSSGENLLLHLMLGGRLYLGDDHDQPDRTKQIILTFDDKKLFFIGLRLGYLHILNEKQLHNELKDLGPEPLDENYTMEQFLDMIRNRRGVLKSTLVNQKIFAGIGNCYSDEICFLACILPIRKINELNLHEKEALYRALKTVLKSAAKGGGYMEMPFYKGDELTGSYTDHLQVYDRGNLPCKRCNHEIIKEEVSSRKCFYCPNCQK